MYSTFSSSEYSILDPERPNPYQEEDRSTDRMCICVILVLVGNRRDRKKEGVAYRSQPGVFLPAMSLIGIAGASPACQARRYRALTLMTSMGLRSAGELRTVLHRGILTMLELLSTGLLMTDEGRKSITRLSTISARLRMSRRGRQNRCTHPCIYLLYMRMYVNTFAEISS